MTAEKGGWQPIETDPATGLNTHGFSGIEAKLRTPSEDLVDPALIKIAEELPEEEKHDAHREVEMEMQLTKEELEAAQKTLVEQKAQVVLEAEIEQVWYDKSHICATLSAPSSLDLGRPQWICNNMQIRVRSIRTKDSTEFHWAIKIPGGDASERLEFEDFVTTTWEDALTKLNEKISELINAEVHGVKFKAITKGEGELLHAKKTRTSYRYDKRPPNEKFPCTGSQVDFDEWTEINGHKKDDGSPILITVDVEGKVLNGDAAGLTPEQARRVPSVENCVWCLSLPDSNGYNLFKMAGEKWPAK